MGIGMYGMMRQYIQSLGGTAVIESNQVRVPYTGTSCFGNVSGTEILKRD